MSLKKQLEILEKISEIAALAGVSGTINEDSLLFQTEFPTKEDRTQLVHIRALPNALHDEDVVTFVSPCLAVKKGMLAGISKEKALDLLQRNERDLIFGRFGIWSGEKEDTIVVSIDHLLSTLDPKEFEFNAWSVAIAADRYEEEHGQEDIY